MHSDIYELPDLKVEMTFGKFVVIIASIFLFLILPINLINTYFPEINPNNSSIQEQSTEGRVAGVETSLTGDVDNIDNQIPLLGDFNLNSQSGVFVLLGLILIGISVLLTLYLFISGRKEEKA